MAMKKCAGEHCDETFEAKAARKYCDLHAGVSQRKKPNKAKPAKAAELASDEVLVVPLTVTEVQLDQFWSKLTIEEKCLAIQTVLDSTQS
jgi:hypothetical protein